MTNNIKRYFVTYNLSKSNALDNRQLVLLVRAASNDDALKTVMAKVKDTDKRDWIVKETVVIDNQPIEVLLILNN